MRRRKTRLLETTAFALAAVVVLVGATPDGELAPKQTTLVTNNMTGDQVIMGPGDPDGFGTARLPNDSIAGRICWHIDTENLTLPITGTLIHAGSAGEVGEVFLPLFGETMDPDPDGCRDDVDNEKLRDLNQNSREFYLEIGDEALPEGAIRGQLHHEKFDT